MKITSAFFLLFILAQAAFSSKTQNIMEVLQRSDEGKEIMEQMLLELSVSGENLNAKTISAVLENITQKAKNALKDLDSRHSSSQKECSGDLATLRKVSKSFFDRSYTVNRHLNVNQHKARRLDQATRRAAADLENYSQYAMWIKSGHKAWKNFYNNAEKSYTQVRDNLKTLKHHLKGLKNTKQAFVELPSDYSTHLSKVQNDFDNSYNQLNGLRPMLANFLELVKVNANLKKDDFRKKAIKVVKHLINNLSQSVTWLREENEGQEGFFDSIRTLYESAQAEAQKRLDNLKNARKNLDRKVSYLQGAFKSANGITSDSQSIVDQRVNECRGYEERSNRQHVRLTKILSALLNLKMYVSDRWGSFKSFIEEKLETSDN
jgi:hypothetical protein